MSKFVNSIRDADWNISMEMHQRLPISDSVSISGSACESAGQGGKPLADSVIVLVLLCELCSTQRVTWR